MPKTNRTKKQHYIAQGVIREFFDSSNIYEKNLHNGRIYKGSVSNTMCMSNSYEFPLFVDNFLEDLFAKSIDSDSTVLIIKLKKLLDEGKYIDAQNMIFKSIRMFLINYYKTVASLIHMSKEMSKKDNSSIARMVNTIFNMPYIDRLSEILCTGYDFSIIKSNDGNFVLSDQYLSTCSLKFIGRFINMSNREIGLKNTIVLIPISKDYYGIFINGQLPNNFSIKISSINKLDESQTRIINNIIFNNSYEKCISLNEKEILNLEKKDFSNGDLMTFAKFKSGGSAAFKMKQEVYFNDEGYEMYKYFESYEWTSEKYKKCAVNGLCPCGSNIKYKKCCKNKVDDCKRMLNIMHFQQDNLFINKKLGCEEPVQLSNYEYSELQKKFEFLTK